MAVLRLTGKRTLSKRYAFDLVVTVAIGSTLATVVLSADVSIAEGVLALILLVVLELAPVTWTSVCFRVVERLAKSEPTLVYRNDFLDAAMRRERVTRDEVRQVARAEGHATLDGVAAVVLETDGTLNILDAAPSPPAWV